MAESVWAHKQDRVHPLPLQLDVNHYESLLYPGVSYHLPEGLYKVAIDMDREYVIGIIVSGRLCPLTVPMEDMNNNYVRVKLHINGNNANKIVPISKKDHLNSLFRELFGPENVRTAAVPPHLQ